MYMSIRRYDGIDPSKVDKLVSEVISGFVPIIQQLSGFVSYQAIDCGGGELATISVFEDKARAEESNRQAVAWAKANISHLVTTPPQIIAGTVLYTIDSLGNFS